MGLVVEPCYHAFPGAKHYSWGLAWFRAEKLAQLLPKLVWIRDISQPRYLLLMPTFDNLLEHKEALNRTLITIVPSEEMVDTVVAAMQELIGNLNLPNTGILAVIPIKRVYGLDRNDYLNEGPVS